MTSRFCIVVALPALLIILPDAAQAEHITTYSDTPSESCATLMERRAAPAGSQASFHALVDTGWISGFWTGLNASATDGQKDTGHTTDGTGMHGEIELYCRNHPSELVINAVDHVWLEFASKGK